MLWPWQTRTSSRPVGFPYSPLNRIRFASKTSTLQRGTRGPWPESPRTSAPQGQPIPKYLPDTDSLRVGYAHYGSPFEIDFVALGQWGAYIASGGAVLIPWLAAISRVIRETGEAAKFRSEGRLDGALIVRTQAEAEQIRVDTEAARFELEQRKLQVLTDAARDLSPSLQPEQSNRLDQLVTQLHIGGLPHTQFIDGLTDLAAATTRATATTYEERPSRVEPDDDVK